MRDFNVFATTKTNHRNILDQLKQLAIQNNTSGASIYDLGNIIKADSIAEVSDILKDAESKQMQMREQEMQQQREMQEQQLQAKAQEQQMKMEFEAAEADKERQKDVQVAEIRAAGYGATVDINENKISDYQDAMKEMRRSNERREDFGFKREQASIKNSMENSKMQIEREKLAAQREVADKQLQIARENKNRYDVKGSESKKDSKS